MASGPYTSIAGIYCTVMLFILVSGYQHKSVLICLLFQLINVLVNTPHENLQLRFTRNTQKKKIVINGSTIKS